MLKKLFSKSTNRIVIISAIIAIVASTLLYTFMPHGLSIKPSGFLSFSLGSRQAAASTEVNYSVSASADDGYVYGPSTFNNNGTAFYIGTYENNYIYNSFYRFDGVTLPAGCTIDVAYVSLYRGGLDGDPESLIYAEDAADPNAIADYSDFYSRTLTTNATTWDDGVTGGYNDSPSIVDVIQELVDTYDYSSGAAIQFIHMNDKATDSTRNRFVWFAYDYSSGSRKPLLHIEYTEAPSEANISNSPSSKAFGVVAANTKYWSNGAEPSWVLTDGDAYFTITNNGDPCSITIESTDFTGGTGWNLVAASPGTNEVVMEAFKEGDDSNEGLIVTNSPQAFISGLVTDIDWEFSLLIGTPTDGVEKTATITLAATLD